MQILTAKTPSANIQDTVFHAMLETIEIQLALGGKSDFLYAFLDSFSEVCNKTIEEKLNDPNGTSSEDLAEIDVFVEQLEHFYPRIFGHFYSSLVDEEDEEDL